MSKWGKMKIGNTTVTAAELLDLLHDSFSKSNDLLGKLKEELNG